MSERWFRTTQRLRYSDNDLNGHLNNAVYATLFESGRVELFVQAKLMDGRSDVATVLAHLEIDFKRELSWPGDALIETAVQRFGAKSVSFRQRVSRDGMVAAEALTVVVMIDRATRRSVPLDAVARERLSPWLLPDAPAPGG